MRDLIICLTAVMVVGGGLSVGRHYVNTKQYERNLQQSAAAPAAGLTLQYLAEAGYEPKTWKDFDAALAHKEPALVPQVAKAEPAPKAAPQPLPRDDRHTAKPEAQPALVPLPVVVQAPPAKPEKKMVGPDGVIFVRTATLKAAVVKATRPVAPESVGLAEQAKAVDTPILVKATPSEPEILPAPQPDKTTVVAVHKPEGDKRTAQLSPAKANPVMVGPDGVIFQPAGAARSGSPAIFR